MSHKIKGRSYYANGIVVISTIIGEKGQTIRSNSSSSGEGVPFAEMFSTTTDKDSLRGTQLTRSLQQTQERIQTGYFN